MTMVEFLPARTMYVDRGKDDLHKVGHDFVSVLTRHLTLDRSYRAGQFRSNDKTLFKEVRILPFAASMTPELRDLFNTRSRKKLATKEALFQAVEEELLKIIKGRWQRGGSHVVLHSSGVDSRILSFLLCEIASELGKDWLGKVLFICTKWEANSFERIMQYQGWDEEQWYIPRREFGEEEYYAAELLDFDSAWRKLGGVAAIPVNLFWWPVAAAKRAGLLQGRVQVWSGYWGNEVAEASSSIGGGHRVRDAFSCLNLSHMCMRPFFGDEAILPWLSVNLIRTMLKSSVKLGKEFRPQFLQWLDSGLADFHNVGAQADLGHPISPHILKEMQQRYDKSWYGRKVKMDVEFPDSTEFHPAWGHWSAASLCEHLLSEGYTIKVG